jgi:hypothetical protein
LEISITASKFVQDHQLCYRVEATITCNDIFDYPLAIAPGLGAEGVGHLVKKKHGKDVVVGALITAEVKIFLGTSTATIEALLEKAEKAEFYNGGNEMEENITLGREGGTKTWDDLQFETAITWLRLVAKRTFNSYGEAREEAEIKKLNSFPLNMLELGKEDILLRFLMPNRERLFSLLRRGG